MEHKIITRAEAKEQGLKYYFTGKPCKNGHVSQYYVSTYACSECKQIRERTAEYKKSRKGISLTYYNKNRLKENKRNKLYRDSNIERERLRNKKYREANAVAIKEYSKAWSKNNSEKCAYSSAKRRAAKLQATPEWLTDQQIEEMKQMYLNCPEGFEVDHKVPLQSDTVCGLHVPCNLGYLTKSENSSKCNRWWEDDWST